MYAWGFRYKTVGFVWVKKNGDWSNRMGLGMYTRSNAEICLVGVSPGFRNYTHIQSRTVRQIVEAPVGRHSEKPGEVKRRIEQLIGDVPRIELFARQPSSGWHVWGNEVPCDITL